MDGSRNVTWYICGPTVYDSSHVGHARNYFTFDIIRRILEDYFQYNVKFVMNVTDVDDKIINRARRNHLMDQYRIATTDLNKVIEDFDTALKEEMVQQEKKHLRHRPWHTPVVLLVTAATTPSIQRRVEGGDNSTAKIEAHGAYRGAIVVGALLEFQSPPSRRYHFHEQIRSPSAENNFFKGVKWRVF